MSAGQHLDLVLDPHERVAVPLSWHYSCSLGLLLLFSGGMHQNQCPVLEIELQRTQGLQPERRLKLAPSSHRCYPVPT